MITPSLVTYGMILLTIYYIFSMVGMEIFGDAVKTQDSYASVYNCMSDKLTDTDFAR